MTVSGITTHILDTSKGKPAMGVPIKLAIQVEYGWKDIGEAITNKDGRAPDLVPPDFQIVAGVYKLTFETGVYFASTAIKSFYPSIPVIFEIMDPESHHHVPLLLSPYGYSTYRGS